MLRFQPFYQEVIWGGRKLEQILGRHIPAGHIGESWELVELPEHHSEVSEGPYKGQRLGDLWRQKKLGGSGQGDFPFLLKWIDAAHTLSVQVHPDLQACQKLGKGRPKTEAWYIAQAAQQAKLMMGHYPGLDSATLEQAVNGQTLQKWLYELSPHEGDIYLLEAGMIHAIGAGTLILEVQQPSDTTFRLYDWGRVGADGLPRPLHLEEAKVAVRYDKPGPPKRERQLVAGPRFRLEVLNIGARLAAHALRVLVCPSADAEFGLTVVTDLLPARFKLRLGEVVILQPEWGEVELLSGKAIWLTESPAEG